jgi:hypothetical protein
MAKIDKVFFNFDKGEIPSKKFDLFLYNNSLYKLISSVDKENFLKEIEDPSSVEKRNICTSHTYNFRFILNELIINHLYFYKDFLLIIDNNNILYTVSVDSFEIVNKQQLNSYYHIKDFLYFKDNVYILVSEISSSIHRLLKVTISNNKTNVRLIKKHIAFDSFYKGILSNENYLVIVNDKGFDIFSKNYSKIYSYKDLDIDLVNIFNDNLFFVNTRTKKLYNCNIKAKSFSIIENRTSFKGITPYIDKMFFVLNNDQINLARVHTTGEIYPIKPIFSGVDITNISYVKDLNKIFIATKDYVKIFLLDNNSEIILDSECSLPLNNFNKIFYSLKYKKLLQFAKINEKNILISYEGYY